MRIFNAADPTARRSIGAKTSASFFAAYAIARTWAEALMNGGADGILYESTRQSPSLCLALFESTNVRGWIVSSRKISSDYDDASLRVQLFAEGVAIIGR